MPLAIIAITIKPVNTAIASALFYRLVYLDLPNLVLLIPEVEEYDYHHTQDRILKNKPVKQG